MAGCTSGKVSWPVEGFGVGIGLAHELVQRQLLDAQIVAGRNFLGADQIEAGLCFPGVGDGGRADLEVAFGRGQLFGHGLFLGLDKAQRVPRGHHIEVGLCGANDQVLFGCIELGAGDVDAQLALLLGEAVDRTVQGLARHDADVLVVGFGGTGRDAGVHIGAVDACGEIHLRAHAGLGLFALGLGRVELGLRGLDAGVVLPSGLVQVGQALCLGRGEGAQRQQGRHGRWLEAQRRRARGRKVGRVAVWAFMGIPWIVREVSCVCQARDLFSTPAPPGRVRATRR